MIIKKSPRWIYGVAPDNIKTPDGFTLKEDQGEFLRAVRAGKEFFVRADGFVPVRRFSRRAVRKNGLPKKQVGKEYADSRHLVRFKTIP